MAKYKIYAGLGGGFGGAQYHGTYDFSSQEEADRYAYDLAWEEYESYGGMHGLSSWDDVYQECLESEWIEPGAQSDGEIEDVVDAAYIEQVESWITWYAKPAVSKIETDSDCDEDEDYNDDDADCYCDD